MVMVLVMVMVMVTVIQIQIQVQVQIQIQIQIQIRRWKRVATQTSTARQRGRTNLKAAPHLMAPVTENHKARLHGGLIHSVTTQTSATAAHTLPLNSLSVCTSTKKGAVRGCLCVVQSG